MICSGMRKRTALNKLFTLVALCLIANILAVPNSAFAKERQSRSRKCRYNKSRVKWGPCDPTVHVKTKVASLVRSRSRSDCPRTRTYTKPCDLKTINYNDCEYIQVSDWSECDSDTNTKTRTLELKSGSTQHCDNTRLESRECGVDINKGEKKDDNAGRLHHHRKNRKKKGRGKKKNRRIKNKSVKKKGCSYRRGKWEPCNEQTGLQIMKKKLKKKSDSAKCDLVHIVTRKCDHSSKEKKKSSKETRQETRRRKKGKNSRKNKKKDKKKSSKRSKKKKKKKDNNNEVSEIPPRLTELHVVPYTDFVVVSWKPPQNDETGRPVPVDGYQIGYGRGFPDVYILRLNASVVSYRIENLEPGGEYVISVRAMNRIGMGQALYDTVMTRHEDKGETSPLLPPVGVMSHVLSSNAINVSWVDLSIKEQATPIERSYFLRYRQLNRISQISSASSSPRRFKTLRTKHMHLVVSELHPFTKYEFAVLTSSGNKNSTWSIMVWNITDQEVPGDAPTDLTYIVDPESPKQVILSWQPPNKPNGIITGYDISYQTSLVEGPPMETKVSVEGNKLSTTLTSLTPGVPYDLSVRACTVKGAGPYRTIQKYTLPGDPAPVPATLKASRVMEDPKAVRLAWEIPDQVDVDILGFVILYTSDLKSNPVHWQVESRIGKDLRMTILDNLMAATTYAFKIQAHTSAGFGPESNTVTIETGTGNLKPTRASGPPKNFRIKILSATSVVASWQDPQSSSSGLEMKMPNPNPVYKLRYRGLDPQPGPYSEVTVYFPSLYLNELLPLTQYEFSVCALKCEDQAQWTKPVVKTTFAVDLSQHPLKVEVEGQKQSPNVAILSWLPHSGANFKEYVIMYTTDPSKPHKHWVQKSAVSLVVKQEVFYDLKPGTTYFFFVQAMTDVGFGPRSKVISYATPEEDESTPSLPHPLKLQAIMVSASSVVLTWQDPGFVHLIHKEKRNPDTFRTYILRYRDMGDRSEGYEFLSTPTQSLFLVTLNPATRYEFSVRVNRGGEHSAWCPPVVNSTFEAAPASAPRNVTVMMDNNDPTSVTLTWKPPQLPNGEITGYIVFYTTNQKQSIRKVSVESVAGSAHSHQISFLKPHKTYYFKMRAHNKKGYSPLSETTVYKTPKVIGAPPYPVTIQPMPGNPHDALVKWQPPANNKRKITHYTLTYHTEDGRDRMLEQLPADSVETIVKGLHESTTYHLSIQAFYAKGAGPHSKTAKYSIPKELLQNQENISID